LDEGDIDIAIMCLCMMGSNCEEYLKECNRILDHNGTLLIIESSKRWMDEDNNKLEQLVVKNKFLLKKIHNQDKFLFLEFIKN
jgi:ubiquinone/menaquinone biosynthesis C-methylase UbiE